MKKKIGTTVVIAILSLLVVGFGVYIAYDKLIINQNTNENTTKKNTSNENAADSINKTITDTNGNKYTLRFIKGTDKSKYEIIDENRTVILSHQATEYNSINDSFDEYLNLHIDSLRFDLHNIVSKSENYEYLGVEYYPPVPAGHNQFFSIIAIHNGVATELVDVGSHGTDVFKAVPDENGELIPATDFNLDNYIIKDNTLTFYYTGCGEDLIKSKLDNNELLNYPLLRITLINNDFTVEKVPVDYVVVGAGSAC